MTVLKPGAHVSTEADRRGVIISRDWTPAHVYVLYDEPHRLGGEPDAGGWYRPETLRLISAPPDDPEVGFDLTRQQPIYSSELRANYDAVPDGYDPDRHSEAIHTQIDEVGRLGLQWRHRAERAEQIITQIGDVITTEFPQHAHLLHVGNAAPMDAYYRHVLEQATRLLRQLADQPTKTAPHTTPQPS